MAIRETQIFPRLDLARSPLKRGPAYARIENKIAMLGNGFMELRLDCRRGHSGQAILYNKIVDEPREIRFSPFEAWFDSGRVSGESASFSGFKASGSGERASLITQIHCEWFDVDLIYAVCRGNHYFQKSIVFYNVQKEAQLQRVSLLRHEVPAGCKIIVHDAGMYFPVVFMRCKEGFIFYCAECPGYFVTVEKGAFSFDYYPGEWIKPGLSYQTLTMHEGFGACVGRYRSNPYHENGATLDIGEQQWFREYLLQNTIPADLPNIEVTGSAETNTEVSDLELLEQCKWLRARSVFIPRMLHRLDSYPLAETVCSKMKALGVASTLSIPADSTPSLHWVALDPHGGPASPDFGACLAVEKYRDALVARYENLLDRFAASCVELPGSPIVACYSSSHDHAPGIESVRRAFEGLADVTEALRQECSRVRCAGPYGTYGAGIVRLFESLPLLAGEYPLPLPDIHLGRLFADMARLYFRRSHDFLVPKSHLRSTVGFEPASCKDAPHPGAEHYPWYCYHDSAGWRYNLISAIATGLHHQFHALPPDLDEADRAFAVKWLAWEKNHLDELVETEEILDEPGLNAVDGYSCATSRGAVVFLFNSGYEHQNVRLLLNLSHDSDYVVREVYPREMNYLGPAEGLFRRNSELTLTMQPKEARIIEAVRRSPGSARRKRAEIFGLEGEEDDGAVRVWGEPGTRTQVGIRTHGKFHIEEVRLPGVTLEKQITDWVYTERSLDEGVSTLTKGAFPGKRLPTTDELHRNVWLCSQVHLPEEMGRLVDTKPFILDRPVWTYPNRMFFVIRFEPPSAFDPIRTMSRAPGVPEAYMNPLPIKAGIDLTLLNLGLKAWINGKETEVYPAIAPWKGFMPNPYPIVAYFFEAGSQLQFGRKNQIVLFVNNFDASAFKGIYIEHFPELRVEKALDLK